MQTFRERLAEVIATDEPFVWAKRHGISAATFDRMWNHGKLPKAQTLIIISRATGASIDWLLMGDKKDGQSSD